MLLDSERVGALLLCSRIMDDHPRVAPESPGDFFDGSDIDELLVLRTLTLGPEEKRMAREADARIKAMLDRVEPWRMKDGSGCTGGWSGMGYSPALA